MIRTTLRRAGSLFTLFDRLFALGRAVGDRKSSPLQVTTLEDRLVPTGNPATAEGARYGNIPEVKLFDSQGGLIRTFLAFESTMTSGVRVSLADSTGDGIQDVIATPLQSTTFRMRIFDGATGAVLSDLGSPAAVGEDGSDPTLAKTPSYVLGSPPGIPSQVQVFNSTGQTLFTFQPYETSYTGGIKTSLADLNGDGLPDILTTPISQGPTGRVFDGANGKFLFGFDPSIVDDEGELTESFTPEYFADRKAVFAIGAGVGVQPEVRVFDGDGLLVRSFLAYESNFTGGVRVALSDLNADGVVDIITAPGKGGGPRVRAFDGVTNAVIADFFAYAPNFTGGVNIAAGPIGDGLMGIATGADTGGGPHVRIFDRVGTDVRSFFVYGSEFKGGVQVALGGNTDGTATVFTSPGKGGGPRLIGVDIATGQTILDQFVYSTSFSGGMSVTTGDLNDDGISDAVLAPGQGGGPHVVAVDGATGKINESFLAYKPEDRSGIDASPVALSDGSRGFISLVDELGDPWVRVLARRGADGNLAEAAHVGPFPDLGRGITLATTTSGDSYFNTGGIAIAMDGGEPAPSLPVVSITAYDLESSEIPTTGMFKITRTGKLDADLLIQASLEGSATFITEPNGDKNSPYDYTSTDIKWLNPPIAGKRIFEVTIPAKSYFTTIKIEPISDTILNENEKVQVVLQDKVNGVVKYTVKTGKNDAQIPISDITVGATQQVWLDDLVDPVAQEGNPSPTPPEATGHSGFITLRRSIAVGALNVSLETMGASDFTFSGDFVGGFAHFNDGVDSIVVSVDPDRDLTHESTGSVTVNIGAGGGYSSNSAITKTITIYDDDAVDLLSPPFINRTISLYTDLTHNDSDASKIDTFNGVLDEQDVGDTGTFFICDSADIASGTYTIPTLAGSDLKYGGSAIVGTDYKLGEFTEIKTAFEFHEPMLNSEGKVVKRGNYARYYRVDILPTDTIDMSRPRNVYVDLSMASTSDAKIYSPNSTTAGGPTVHILGTRPSKSPEVSVGNMDKTATEYRLSTGGIKLVRTDAKLAFPLTVNYHFSGTAAYIWDYKASLGILELPQKGTVTFPTGQKEIYVTINPVDDTIPEIPEIARITIDPGDYTIGTRSGDVTIIDDDYDKLSPTGKLLIGINGVMYLFGINMAPLVSPSGNSVGSKPGLANCPPAARDAIYAASVALLDASCSLGTYTKGPVRYADGAIAFAIEDMASDAQGLSVGLSRSYSNKPIYSTGTVLGNGWMDSYQPFLVTDEERGTIAVVSNGNTARFFDRDADGNFVSRLFIHDKLEYDTDGHEYRLTTETGSVFHFFDFDNVITEKQGRLSSIIDPASNTITLDYDPGAAHPSQMIRSTTIDSHVYWERVAYTYGTIGDDDVRLFSAALQRKTDTGTWSTVRTVVYEYYGEYNETTSPNGENGDLKRVTVKDSAGEILNQEYYRYWHATTSEPGLLKYAFRNDSFRRLQSIFGSAYEVASDEAIKEFAGNYFAYDEERRVTTEVAAGEGCSICADGLGTFTFSYYENPDEDLQLDLNTWWMRTTETLPDDTVHIVYTNPVGQVMLDTTQEMNDDEEGEPTIEGRRWSTFNVYDENGRRVLTAEQSAILDGWSESYPDLMNLDDGNYTYLDDSNGFVTVMSWYDSDTATATVAGGAAGYFQKSSIRHGELGTPTIQSQVEYTKYEGPVTNRYEIANTKEYPTSDGLNPNVTNYSYTWDDQRLASMSVMLPIVSIAQNGSGDASAMTVMYDRYGRATWSKDAGGFIQYFGYDPITGAEILSIDDIDIATATTAGLTIPTGWAKGGYTGTHLRTDSTVDNLGRPTKITTGSGGEARTDYIIYSDPAREIRYYPGWTGTAATGPTVVSRADDAGWFSEILTMSKAPDVKSGVPTGAEDIDDIESLSRTLVNNAGQPLDQDDYFNLNGIPYSASAKTLGSPGYNYLRTSQQFNMQGLVKRIELPDGTISRIVYDDLKRPISEWRGDSDTVLTDFWSPENKGDMIQISAYEYDGGGTNVGDSNITKITLFPAKTDEPARITTYSYDWRNRPVFIKEADTGGIQSTSTDRPLTYMTYDNLDRVTRSAIYDGDGVNVADADSDGVPDDPYSISGKILPYADQMTEYDSWGRAFRTTDTPWVHSGTYATAPVAGTPSVSQVAFDSRGLPVAVSVPGGLTEKTEYDGAGRVVRKSLVTARQSSVALFHRLFGDGDGNGNVDAADMSLFGNTFGQYKTSSTFNGAFDYNNDGFVDSNDFGYIGNNFGKTVPTGTTSSNFVAVGGKDSNQRSRITGFDITFNGSLTSTGDIVVRRYDTAGNLTGEIPGDFTSSTASGKTTLHVTFNAANGVFHNEIVNGSFNDGLWQVAMPGFTFDGKSVMPLAATSTSLDYVWQESRYTYDSRSQVIQSQTRDRFDGQTAPGPLGDATSGIRARVSNQVFYYDLAGRPTDTVDVGTSQSSTWTRPSTVPTRSSTSAVPRVNSFVYGTNGLVSTMTDPNAIQTTATYDLLGRTLTTTAAASSSIPYTMTNVYDSKGRLDQVVLPGTEVSGSYVDRITKYGYDNFGRGNSVTEFLGLSGIERTSSVLFNNLDEAVRTIDADGTHTDSAYDAVGRVQSVTEAANVSGLARTTTMAYDPLGRTVSVTDANTNTTKIGYYDENGPKIVATDAKSVATTERYDLAGNLVFTSVGAVSNTMTYDAIGRVTTSRNALANTTTNYQYFVGGTTHVQTDPLLHTSSVELDSLDMPAIIRDGLTHVVSTSAYDAGGRLQSVTDANSHVTKYAYDDLNRVKTLTEAASTADQRVTSYIYDDHTADLLRITNPRGVNTDIGYDLAGRAISQTQAADSSTTDPFVTTTVYDLLDRPTFVTSGGRTTQYQYDALSQSKSVTEGYGTSLARTTSFGYDAVGNQTTVTDPFGFISLTKYDEANRPYEFYQDYGGTDQIKTSATYDSRNFMVSATDGNGNKTQFFYDNAGRRTQIRDARNKNTTFTYDTANNMLSVRNGLNQTNTFTYDDADRLVSVMNPLAETVSFEYDDAGNRTKLTDARLYDTYFTYDALNRLKTSKNALNEVTTYGYDPADNLTTVTNAKPATWTTTYDDLNRLTKVSDPLDHAIQYKYHATTGDLIEITDQIGKVTTLGYDDLGRQTTVTRPADGTLFATTTTYYDELDRVWKVKDAEGYSTQMDYDHLGRVKILTDANGKDSSFTYDNNGNRLTLTDPIGNTTTFKYDSVNRLTEEIDPLSQSTFYGYDDANRLTSIIDRDGQERGFTYNAGGRKTAENWYTDATKTTLLQQQTFSYDENGNLLTATDPDGDYTITYDPLNRAETVLNPSGLGMTFTYDKAGNRDSVTDSDGRVTASTFDAANRLESRTVTNAKGSLRADYTWTNRNEMAGVTRYSDLAGTTLVGTSAYTYDDGGRLTSLVHRDGASTPNVLADFEYQYNLNDWLTQKNETVGVTTTTTTYGYDNLGQVTGENSNSYSYDAGGNRQNHTLPTAPNGNRISSDGTWDYTYTANSEVDSKTDGTTTWNYSYDLRGQMVSAGNGTQTVTYKYDAFGNRIGRNDGTDETVYTLDGWDTAKPIPVGTENFDVYLEQTNIDPAVLRMYGPGVDLHGARLDDAGAASWYLTDRQGSVRQATDATGSVVGTQDFDAFGNVTATTGAMPDSYGYTGRDLDLATGLQNNRARWYDSHSGRWMSEDPIGFAGGDVNLFRYAGNQSSNASDPSGNDIIVRDRDLDFWKKIIGNDNLEITNIGNGNYRLTIRQSGRTRQLHDQIVTGLRAIGFNESSGLRELLVSIYSGDLDNRVNDSFDQFVDIGSWKANYAIELLHNDIDNILLTLRAINDEISSLNSDFLEVSNFLSENKDRYERLKGLSNARTTACGFNYSDDYSFVMLYQAAKYLQGSMVDAIIALKEVKIDLAFKFQEKDFDRDLAIISRDALNRYDHSTIAIYKRIDNDNLRAIRDEITRTNIKKLPVFGYLMLTYNDTALRHKDMLTGWTLFLDQTGLSILPFATAFHAIHDFREGEYAWGTLSLLLLGIDFIPFGSASKAPKAIGWAGTSASMTGASASRYSIPLFARASPSWLHSVSPLTNAEVVMSLKTAARNGSVEARATLELIERGRISIVIYDVHNVHKWMAGQQPFGTNRIVLYANNITRTPYAIAGITSHEAKHWLQRIGKLQNYHQGHEYEALWTQMRVDPSFPLRSSDAIWNYIRNHHYYGKLPQPPAGWKPNCP